MSRAINEMRIGNSFAAQLIIDCFLNILFLMQPGTLALLFSDLHLHFLCGQNLRAPRSHHGEAGNTRRP